MSRLGETTGTVLALTLLIGTLAAGIGAIAWRSSTDDGPPGLHDAVGALRRVQFLQKTYHDTVDMYATELEELDIRLPEDGAWSFRLVAMRLDEKPLLLIEADNGTQRLVTRARGPVCQSRTIELPPVAPWRMENGDAR